MPTPAPAGAYQHAQQQAEHAWAALAPAVAGGIGRARVSRDGGRSYPACREAPLPHRLPNQPAAVRTYDDDGYAHCLSADLDTSRAGQAQVDQDHARLLALIERCGGRAFSDSSPTGGRHVYLPLAQPVHHDELRPVLHALSRLLPSLDVLPAASIRSGCLRPPGARHRTGGWQRLDGSLEQAVATARNPNPPAVWAALTRALRPQLDALTPPTPDLSLVLPEQGTGAGPAERAAHALANPRGRHTGRRPGTLNSRALAIATNGDYDIGRYPTPSHARQAVHASAAGSGWSYSDLTTALEAGELPGLWALYSRYQPHQQRPALARDWTKALAYATRDTTPGPAPEAPPPDGSSDLPNHAHNSTTREHTTHRGGGSATAVLDDPRAQLSRLDAYQYVRTWWTALRITERQHLPGRAGLTARLVLRALGNAAQKTGQRQIGFGVRSLAVATGLSHSTVSTTLRTLREADDPLLSRVREGRGLVGDLYELRIPDNCLQQAVTVPWRAGRIEALLPVFRTLGVAASFIYEALDTQPQTSWDTARSALLSTRATQQALTELAAHGLATRSPNGWTRGPADPQLVADTLGALEHQQEQVERYRRDRIVWRARLGMPEPLTVDAITAAATAPPLPRDAGQTAATGWTPAQPHAPPVAQLSEAACLDIVMRELGGRVITDDGQP